MLRFRSSRQFPLPVLLPVIVPLLAPVASFAQGWQHIGSVQKVEKLSDGVELTSGKAKVRVTVFRDGIFRVRVAQTGTFSKDFSWAVIETPEPPAVKVDDTKEEVRVTSGNIVARIRKSPLLIDFLRDIGKCLIYFGKLRVNRLTKPATRVECWRSADLYNSSPFIRAQRRLGNLLHLLAVQMDEGRSSGWGGYTLGY